MSRDRAEKLRRMAEQADSPMEAETARRLLEKLPPTLKKAAAPKDLVYAGRRNGVPHYWQRPPEPAGADPGSETLPGSFKHPRKLARRKK
mgnify:CR=1 FL=1